MRRFSVLIVAVALAHAAPASAAFVPPNAPDQAGLPASCAELVNGTTGERGRPAGAPVPVRDGPATVPAAAGAGLPALVAFRGIRESFNQRFDVAARGGSIFIRARGTATWERLVLPPCMDGRIDEVAIDRDLLIATDARGNVYSSGNALQPVERIYESWTLRWGPLFWAGPGVRIPDRTVAWNVSGLTVQDDQWFLDSAGRRQDVIGIATVYALRDDGRITYLDPWLPADDAYEVCGPRRGRFRAVGLAASGSTMLLIGRAGELYTRQYDFDISGADIVQLRYSWEDQRAVADLAIQLPPRDWTRQPAVPGTITTRVSIHTTGAGTNARVLRVEGLDARGRTGYWEKPIARGRWRFTRTDLPLQGRRVVRRPGPLLPGRDVDYAGLLADGTRIHVRRLNPYCSPAALIATTARGHSVSLKLHTVDGLRQLPEASGFSDVTREKYGAIERPRGRFPADVGKLLRTIFPDARRRFRETRVHATRGTLWIDGLCWRLRHPGAPAGEIPTPEGC